MAIQRRQLHQRTLTAETRLERAHVRERYELVFDDRDQRDGDADASRIDLVQIDRLGETNERFGDVRRGVCIAARQQIGLDRELESPIDPRRRTAEELLSRRHCDRHAGG